MQSPKTSLALALAICMVVLLALVSAGCGTGPSEDEEERSEATQLQHRGEVLRHNASRRADLIQRTFSPHFQSIAGRPDCTLALRPMPRPRSGLVPIACGNFPAPWPLNVQHGFLRCEEAHHTPTRRRVVFTSPQGAEYAVNVYARIVGYAKLSPLLVDRGDGLRAKRLLTDRGLLLC